MRKLKYFRQIAVAIIIATLLCDKGIVIANAANMPAEISVLPGNERVSANALSAGTDGKAEWEISGLEGTEGTDYAAGEVILVLEDAGIATLGLEGIEEEITGDEDGIQFAVVDIEDDMSVEEAVDYYSELPGVAYAQPNYIYEPEEINLPGKVEASEERNLPKETGVQEETRTQEENNLWEESVNDLRYGEQWYLDFLNMEKAWSLMESVPCKKVRVAVIDSGIDLYHTDLYANINENLCVNSVTTDYPKMSTDYSANGHGTHVAGIIGAVTGNGQGVAGIANNYAEIIAIQSHDGSAMKSSYVVNAIQYAADKDVDIINMSMGTSQEDKLLKDAMEDAYNRGILIVCSAGNDGTDNKHYPSAYDSAIGVIAVTQTGARRSDASYGTDNFISAPGDKILSTLPGTYGYQGGSSMSAGMVSGVAAAVWSANPSLSVEEVKTILAQTATDTYSQGFDAYSGWGIVAADKAVEKAIEMRYASGELPAPSEPEAPKQPEPETPELPDILPDSAESFVKRLYRYCLGREAEEAGLSDWTRRLESGRENGGEVAAGFFFSDEMRLRNLNDEEFVELLYRVFLARESDEAGKADWVMKLKNGMSRQYVMNGFSASAEFAQICRNCGFGPGSVPTGQMRDKNQQITAFVARMYEKALGRSFDEDGLNDWCGRLINQNWTPYRVATEGFFHSREFLNQNTTDEEFVKILYRTFLNREYDEEGLYYWLARLALGESRDTVIAGFANSREFDDFMAKYGLKS